MIIRAERNNKSWWTWGHVCTRVCQMSGAMVNQSEIRILSSHFFSLWEQREKNVPVYRVGVKFALWYTMNFTVFDIWRKDNRVRSPYFISCRFKSVWYYLHNKLNFWICASRVWQNRSHHPAHLCGDNLGVTSWHKHDSTIRNSVEINHENSHFPFIQTSARHFVSRCGSAEYPLLGKTAGKGICFVLLLEKKIQKEIPAPLTRNSEDGIEQNLKINVYRHRTWMPMKIPEKLNL